MKRTLLCLVLSALPMKAGLWEAICQVESSGNPRAVGDGGKAVGIAQIHPIIVRDVNAFAGTSFTLKDRLDPVKSKAIFDLYIERYAKGRSVQFKARIWNGGPKGAYKGATLAYWRKIQSKL